MTNMKFTREDIERAVRISERAKLNRPHFIRYHINPLGGSTPMRTRVNLNFDANDITNHKRASFWLPRAIKVGREFKGKVSNRLRFNLSYFGMVPAEFVIDKEERELIKEISGYASAERIGLTACFASWLGLHPTFRKAGLKFVAGQVYYKSYNGSFRSLAEFFGISNRGVSVLFGDEGQDHLAPSGWPAGQRVDGKNPDHAVARMVAFCEQVGIEVPPEEEEKAA